VKLEPADIAALDDSQKVAVLEALVTAIFSDGRITQGEIRRFDEIVVNLPWGVEPQVLDAMVKGTQTRVAGLKTLPQITDFVANLAARLPTPALRDKVVYTMATVMYADGEIAQLEKNVLGMFILSFGITSDRVAAIKSAVTGQPVSVPPSTAS
jgi:uncharacterized tellurite resistance protein B-like protein